MCLFREMRSPVKCYRSSNFAASQFTTMPKKRGLKEEAVGRSWRRFRNCVRLKKAFFLKKNFFSTEVALLFFYYSFEIFVAQYKNNR